MIVILLNYLRQAVLKNSCFSSGRLVVLFASLLFILFTMGCSTQKNKLPNRIYHSVNAKYNGYFNARENYREGVSRLSIAHIDNFDQVLSIFRYGNEQQAGSVSTYMDVAYQKASTVIRRHSMNIRGVEYNPWIDESFYLIARSHFFKRDYNLAILTFEYIVRQYESDTKYLAKAWIAKSYIQQARYEQAQQFLERLAKNQSDGVLSKKSSRMFQLVYADFHIRQDNFASAAPYLSEGIKITSDKKERTRLTFILAQVYQHGGDFGNAQATYARVLKMNPSFDLAFQARISMAMAFDPSGGSGSDQIKTELLRMIRDKKNKSYRDQIYYALGQMSMRQNRTTEAIDNFLTSTQVSEDNRLQKALSFTRLGEIYFAKPQYLQSSIYYDSAIVYLPSQHEIFPQVNAKKMVLTSLANNIRIIEREDSLQRLAAMTDAARNAVIDKIIADLRAEEAQAKLIEQQMMRAASTIAQSRIRGGVGAQEGGWYFYNTTAMSFGRTEFFSKYGERPLEDLWRISNKQVAGFDMDMEGDELEEEGEPAGDKFDRNTYMRNIPTTPEQLNTSNQRIATAHYNMSMTFKDRLNDYESAVSSLEKLVDRFPQSDRKLHAYYYLYTLYRELGDTAKANMFRNRLVAEFPDSDFANIIGDPNYLEKILARYQFANRLYEQTYRAFNMGQYELVISNSEQADTLDIPKQLKSQFSYVRALATGKLGKRSEFRKQLENIVSSYDGLPVHQPASNLLASLEIPGTLPIEFEEEPADEPADDIFESMYTYKDNVVHFFIFVVQSNMIDATQIRNFVNTFNGISFPDAGLSSSTIFLDDRRQLITVTNFADKAKGMDYYQKMLGAEGFSAFDQQALQGFVISVENYPSFYQEKNVDEYLRFFQHYYVNQ